MGSWGKRLFGISLLLFVVGVSGLVWLFSKQEMFAVSLKPVDEQRTITETVKSLDLATDTVDVLIERSSQPSVSVRLVGEVDERQRYQLTSDISPDGKLTVAVTEQMHINMFFWGNGHLQLHVLLPDAAYDQIALKTETGDIRSMALQSRQARIRTSTGDIDLDGFSGERLEVQTETGDMRMQGIKAQVSVESSTGDVNKLELTELVHDADIRTDTGDVRISVEKKPSAARLELASDTGDVQADWPNLTYERREEQHVTATVGTGGPALSVRSSTGDIRIQ
ncbi:DUF4097 family beta strand repeat-containing protein [Brevibacillus brevis]|uniref:DUF4097 family beta strand repeat-containing protein n=1 Tax=Brevibacillus brevis TaxID=1393 RepID=A0ABY9T9B8_BREBE|nr:DUF4097 family beta strand repeat-containing protein [Brevibacillus brevis]WNC16685.1 DUF4097 family beta strand repeat-containing protein [Brevibacillus brevis]